MKLFKQFTIKKISRKEIIAKYLFVELSESSSSNDNDYKIVRKIYEIHTFFIKKSLMFKSFKYKNKLTKIAKYFL